jgi:hypothetical protein
MAIYDWSFRIGWIVYVFVLVGLWGLSSRIKNEFIKWGCWGFLGLLAGLSLLLFFATCLGIGIAGCQ